MRKIVTILCFALLVAGCGGGTTTAPASGGGAFPVSIIGKFGTTTVSAQPKRIVAMDWTSADMALALGVTPVGIAKVPTSDDGLEPWTKTSLKGATPTLFSTDDGDPIEQVAALKPDLILAVKDYNLQQSYALLSKIAPVVTYAKAPNSDSWQDSTRTVGKALGVQADAVIAHTNAAISSAKAAHPELAGKTFNFLVSPQSTGVYAVNSTTDVSAQLIAQLGMTLAPAVQKMPTSNIPGRTLVSYENLGSVDADVLLATGPPKSLTTLKANAIFKTLKVVQKNAYVPLQATVSQAIAFPSSTSIEWALRQVLPKLSAAAGQ